MLAWLDFLFLQCGGKNREGFIVAIKIPATPIISFVAMKALK
ncbi:MAG: hypothetical protein ACTSVV_15080 [Promethearchaeota archaeon]